MMLMIMMLTLTDHQKSMRLKNTEESTSYSFEALLKVFKAASEVFSFLVASTSIHSIYIKVYIDYFHRKNSIKVLLL